MRLPTYPFFHQRRILTETAGRITMTTPSDQRLLIVAAAQLGPIKSLDTPRSEALNRMIKLCTDAAEKNVRLLVFPELAFTTFFPGYIIEKQEHLDKFFEPASPEDPYAIIHSPHGKPLFEKAAELRIDIYVGYGERWTAEDGKVTYYNTAIYYSASQQRAIAKYRKVHLPGRYEPDPRPGVTQQLEKRVFAVGDLGFEAFRVPDLISGAVKSKEATSTKDTQGQGDPIMGMLLCNDRRWAECWRSYGLQGVEIVLVSRLRQIESCPSTASKGLYSDCDWMHTGGLQHNCFRAAVSRNE
jgi:predicted amidohydrolase